MYIIHYYTMRRYISGGDTRTAAKAGAVGLLLDGLTGVAREFDKSSLLKKFDIYKDTNGQRYVNVRVYGDNKIYDSYNGKDVYGRAERKNIRFERARGILNQTSIFEQFK